MEVQLSFAFNVLGQLPGHSGCFQSAPLNHWYGEAMGVYPQDSLLSAQGLRDAASEMRVTRSGAGAFPSWDAVPEGITSQEQRAAGALCREVGMDGFIDAPQLMPDPTAQECLCGLGTGRQEVLRHVYVL